MRYFLSIITLLGIHTAYADTYTVEPKAFKVETSLDAVFLPAQSEAVIINPAIRREVDRSITKIAIKPLVQRPSREPLRPIVRLSQLPILLGSAGFQDRIPVPAQVPLAEAPRAIPLLLEHPRNREFARLKDRLTKRIDDPMETPPMMLTGEQRIAAGRANPGRAVPIRKRHPPCRQAIDVRSLNLCLRISVRDIRHAHVIRI